MFRPPPPLPEVPTVVSEFSPREACLVGWAARRVYGGRQLPLRPGLYVEAADVALLTERWPALVADPYHPGWWESPEGWHVRPVDDLEEALVMRSTPVDAFGVRLDGTLLDPLGGRERLERGDLSVDGLEGRLGDDPSLVCRLPALASELGVRLDGASLSILEDGSPLCFKVPRDVVRAALTRLLVGRRPSEGLLVLARTRALHFMLPEVAAMIDFHRSSLHHHKDVWNHSRIVVCQSLPRPVLRWAALLHDIGKVHTRSFGPRKAVHFFRHEELGAYMFEGIAARLHFPPQPALCIRQLIANHLRANLYDGSWSDAGVRRFARDLGPLVGDLINFSRADVTSTRRHRRREALASLFELRNRMASIATADAARAPKVPKGLGGAIIEGLGVAPGRAIGDLRRVCEQAIEDGILCEEPDIDACIDYLRKNHASLVMDACTSLGRGSADSPSGPGSCTRAS